jgi:hypothetical protein
MPIQRYTANRALNNILQGGSFGLAIAALFVIFVLTPQTVVAMDLPWSASLASPVFDSSNKGIKGFILTADRLMHEPDERGFPPVIIKNGIYRYHDPVERNDFWWYK